MLPTKAGNQLVGTAPRKSTVEFDPLVDSSDEFLRDPYPMLNSLREQGTVLWSERGHQWIVTGYEEAMELLRDNTYGKHIERWKHPSPIMRMMVFMRTRGMRSMLIQDPPEHTRIRSLVNGAFTPSVVKALEAHIQDIANQLIDGFISDGQSDLISQYAFTLPVTVIAELLGVPASDRLQFKQWSTAITASLQGNFCPMRSWRSLKATADLQGYLRNAIKQKRDKPTDDLLHSLAAVQSQGDGRLSEEELVANSSLLLLAGHETTVNLIGNGLYNLLRSPSDLALLKEQPELIPNAVDEFLRFDPPVQLVRRVANADATFHGAKIKKNQGFTVLLGACNRDPRQFDRPDVMDLTRQNNKHISFGAGVHYCLGSELARAEARIAISTALRRLNNMALATDSPPYKGPFALRGLRELPVTFTE